MASYPRTGTTLNSRTHTALSTQIIIMVNNEPVGAVQSLSINQRRAMARIKEIGTDGVIEIVPQSAAEYSASLKRTVFDGLSAPEALSRGYQIIGSQRIPFDIVMIDQNTGTGDEATITVLRNCWISSLNISYSSDNYILVQDMNIEFEQLYSTRGGEAVSQSQGVGGGRQISGIQIDQAELEADSGQRRGSLDFPGLISAAY